MPDADNVITAAQDGADEADKVLPLKRARKSYSGGNDPEHVPETYAHGADDHDEIPAQSEDEIVVKKRKKSENVRMMLITMTMMKKKKKLRQNLRGADGLVENWTNFSKSLVKILPAKKCHQENKFLTLLN
jgi:actin-related protein